MNCDRGQGRLLCKECCRVAMQEISLRIGFTQNGPGWYYNAAR